VASSERLSDAPSCAIPATRDSISLSLVLVVDAIFLSLSLPSGGSPFEPGSDRRGLFFEVSPTGLLAYPEFLY